MVTKSVKLTPVESWFRPTGFGQRNTGFCIQHAPNCIVWYGSFISSYGKYNLVSPLNIRSILPGTNQRLKSISFETMRHQDHFAVITPGGDWGAVRVICDNSIVAQIDESRWRMDANRGWLLNTYDLNLDLTQYRTLDIEIEHYVATLMFGLDDHIANMILTFEYTPSEVLYGNVEVYVYDITTQKPVTGAYLRLMSGSTLIDVKYTDPYGKAIFKNVITTREGTSYELRVTKSGYQDRVDTVEVKPNTTTSYSIGIEPVQKEPFTIPPYIVIPGTDIAVPTWSLIAAGGIAALGIYLRRRSK